VLVLLTRLHAKFSTLIQRARPGLRHLHNLYSGSASVLYFRTRRTILRIANTGAMLGIGRKLQRRNGLNCRTTCGLDLNTSSAPRTELL